MPLYKYECRECGKTTEIVHSISEMQEERFCACNGELFRVICASTIQPDISGYRCPVTGKWIGSRREHRRNLEANNCRVLESGEREEARRRRKAQELALDKKIEDSVGRDIHNLPREKQKALQRELESGASVAVVRQ